MTPDEYRAAFDLKADYPLVPPASAAQRSALAKSLGLGRKPGAKAAGAPPPPKKTGRGPAKKAAASA